MMKMMKRGSVKAAIKAEQRKQRKMAEDARRFFLSMQAKGWWKRQVLAFRLVWRVDLRRQVRREGVTLRELRKRGLVDGVL